MIWECNEVMLVYVWSAIIVKEIRDKKKEVMRDYLKNSE